MVRTGVKGNYAAPALDKAFEILELLADHGGGVTISEMSSKLGRSVGELFRIVIVMENHGYLQKSASTDRYSLAYKLLDLAFRATPAQDLVEAATPEMKALVEDVEQSCHLVVVNGGQGLIVSRKETPGTRGFALKVGAAIDMLSSCSGNVLLAFSSVEERAQIVELATQAGARPRTDVDLAAHLESVREQGFDSRKSPITFGVTDISFPLFGFAGDLMGALTIPFLELVDGSQKVGLEATRLRLATAAYRISSRLGWQSERTASTNSLVSTDN